MSSTSKGGSGLGTSTKMCKSSKNSSGIYQKPDSTSSLNSTTSAPSYESLNTNCTVVGSNNLHLLKKNHQQVIQQPQQVQLQVQSPIYSNASPIGGMVFPTPTSPYMGGGGTISPAPVQKGIGSPSLGVKSPQPTQTQVLTSPQQNYSVMQIIHNPLIGRPIQSAQQPSTQNIIKLKPHLNILPKPASIQQVPRSSVSPHQQLLTIPSVSPTTLPTHNQQHTLLSAHQPAANQPPPIIINQLPTHAMLTAAGQLQFILRPATAAAAHQTTTHAPTHHVPVSIANSANIHSKQLGHLTQQQLNGLLQLQQQQQQLATLQLPPPPPPPALVGGRCAQAQQVIQQVHLQAAGASQQTGQQMVRLMTNGLTSGSVVQGIMQQQAQTGTTYITTQNHIQPPVNISPKKRPKKKKQKLDLANIMKLSGIGDDDDVQFESDTSQSEGEPNSHSQSSTPQPQISVVQSSQSPAIVNTATSAAAAAAAVQAAAVQAAAFQQHQQQQLMQNQMLQPATLATLLQSLQQQQQVQAAHKQQLGNIQIPTVQTAAPNIVQLLSNQSFTTTPSGLVTPTTSTPHILSIPTSSATLTAQHHPAATQQSIPTFAAAHSTAGVTTAGPTTAGFTLNGATAATLQRAAAAAGQNLGAAGGGASTTTLPVPVTGLGGFKLALGEDGRLVLQHDPGLQQQQDLQSQLLLQTIFGLSGGGLLLQPTTIDQQVHSQTVQTIQQQQTVQTIQQQTVQSQTVQHHSLQTIQQTIQPQIQAQTVQQTIHHHHHHQVQQPVAPSQVQQVQQVQPIQSVQTQQQQQQQAVSGATTMQLVQPQTIQQLIHQQQHMHNQAQVVNGIAVSPVPASSPVQQHHHHHQHHVVNSIAPLPHPIGIGHGHNHHHQPVLKVQPFQKSQPAAVAPQSAPNITPPSPSISSTSTAPPTSYVVNLTPDQLEQLKRNGQLTVNGQTIFMQRPQHVSETAGAAHIGNGNSGGTATMTSTIGAGGVQVDHKVSMQQMGGAMGVCQSMIGGQMKLTPKTIKRKSGCNKILGNKDLTALNVGTPAHPHMATIAAHSTVYTNQQSAVNSHLVSKGITGSSNIDKVINTVVREAAKSAGLMNSTVNIGSGVQKLQHQITSTNKQVPNKKSPNQIRPLILGPKQNTTKNNQSTTTIAPPQSAKQSIASNTTRSLPNLTSPTQAAPMKDQTHSNNQEVVDRLLGQIIEESQQQKVAMPSAKSITTTKTTTTTAAAPSNATVSNGPSVTTNSLLTASACGNQNNKVANTGQQRVHTIQLTPQQQQYLKSIQLQIQTLNARGQQSGSNGDVEVQNALKVLFLEQQKILASGKLLPPDKVFYHNNQIIVNTGSGSAPTVLSTSGLTVVQPPPGKGLEALGFNLGGGGQMQHQTVVTKTDVGTSTNGCGGITNSTNVGNKSNHQQPQSAKHPIGSITHHPVNCNIAKSIQQTSPDSSTTQQSPSKLPSLPSLHPLQQINIPVSSSTNSTLAHNLQQQQQSVGQTQALVVQLNQSNSSQGDSTACSIVNTLGTTKVPRPILPRLPVQQHQNAPKQPSTISSSSSSSSPSSVSIGNSESVTNCNAVINQNQLVSVSQQSGVQICQQIKNSSKAQLVQQPPVQQPLTGYMKAQRIEQQLTSDQSGAVNPDIQTPFRDKADACQRLLRYHCYDQPVLSEKDLTKADEIFELTARHFIDKFGRMVDKYRYLLLKEGQRHVQTSELMMLDRMFLAEEQQSLLKLRQDIEEGNFDALLQNDQKENHSESSKNIYKEQQCVVQERQEQEVQLIDLDIADKLQTTVIDNDSVVGSLNELSDDEIDDNLEEKDDEEYDEWQCIQRELGCLAAAATTPPTSVESINQHCINMQTSSNSKLLQTNTNSNSSNCSNSSSTSSSSCFSSASGFGKRLSNNIGNNEPTKRYKGTRIVPEDSSAPSSAITTATHCTSFSANSTANTTNNTDEMDNSGSIDEQVQSAIDSILNLQQQTSGIVTSHSKNDADRLGIS